MKYGRAAVQNLDGGRESDWLSLLSSKRMPYTDNTSHSPHLATALPLVNVCASCLFWVRSCKTKNWLRAGIPNGWRPNRERLRLYQLESAAYTAFRGLLKLVTLSSTIDGHNFVGEQGTNSTERCYVRRAPLG